MRIPADVLAALTERAETDGPRLVLTGTRMTPALYRKVNEVLEAVGGQWSKSAVAHLFPADAAGILATTVAAGEVVTAREKRTLAQYFPTPVAVVKRLVDLAQLAPGMTVLEPSAGSGAIATAAAACGAVVDCIEQDPGYAATLTETGTANTLRIADFLAVPAEPCYDRVVMNPPFTRGADIAHVEHALRFLKPDGLLVSVMSWAVTEHGPKTAKFRALVVARGGTVEAVPAGSFRQSGTDVDTVLVTIPAARPAGASATVWPARDAPGHEEPDLREPAEIVAEIQADLREALAHFDAVAAMLAKPAGTVAPQPGEVAELPAPRQEQLLFEPLDEAS